MQSQAIFVRRVLLSYLRVCKDAHKPILAQAERSVKQRAPATMRYPSKLIETAVEEVSKLPGIGRKTALRLVLHLLACDAYRTASLSGALTRMRAEIKYCKDCHSVADDAVCSVCRNPHRDTATLCVVENVQDVLAIENTQQYQGLYHVLGGVVNPSEGIGPERLHIDSLCRRVGELAVKEIIFALSATIEGDTTMFYIVRKRDRETVKISTIARGVAVGSDLEYTDEVTLGRSITHRTHYTLSS